MTSPLSILRDVAFVATGIASAGFGLKGFLLPGGFVDGGVTGISMLLAASLGWPLAVSIPLINLPFVAAGYVRLGRAFALKTALGIVGLTACVAFVPYPHVTPDPLLAATFGGAFIGAGIGLAMRGGAVLDGTEVAALLVRAKTSLLKVSDIILILNVAIFGAAIFLLGVTPALYSILTYVAASKALQFIVSGIDPYVGVTIVSQENEEIRRCVTEELGRGVTLYRAKGGFGKRDAREEESEILFTVITRLDVPPLLREVKRIDPRAFVTQHAIDDASGGILKVRPFH